MKTLIAHARTFAHSQGAELGELAAGQSPYALFITCSDSRVIPSLITGARPGELFELRTAGNIVPPYDAGPTSEAATIEYAVKVLGVSDIVVCGHSHCGAVGALVRGDDLSAVPAVREWLGHAAVLPSGAPDDPQVAEAVQHHVLGQVLRLVSYPCVETRLRDERLRVHAWFYEVHTGGVLVYRAESDSFETL
ncbi:carbonic anhydrase [Streptomyces sp. DT2A-34]|uniref:carbonic anhydrase n=1 Tax=Streptomyces sp. DT2A-34 TaxID=3051182 RepID=UPI00265C20F9|nr:carbonic anhydrase [Streptomyces sp. DT2A-34]MDO0911258.1 carbonic anhydrase [Streptomyces sp. DT2A-34]